MASVETLDDPLAEAEVVALVENHARRHGATPAQERDRVESARRALDVLREQGRSPRVLVAALRLETRRTNWGVLCGPSEWERLTADFERAFLEG